MSKQAIVYVDGHNFYHGSMKDSPALKWLDLEAFASALLGRVAEAARVKYYTARVVDLGDPSQSQRQDVYLRALATLPCVEVVEGRFARREKKVTMKSDGKLREAIVYEEKGTDVNLAADLVHDACMGIDVAVVVSNDSDLQRALDIACRQKVEVYVVNPYQRTKRLPTGRRNRRYRPALVGSGRLTIHKSHLYRSQLPDVVHVAEGELHRPPEWT